MHSLAVHIEVSGECQSNSCSGYIYYVCQYDCFHVMVFIILYGFQLFWI